MTPIKKPTSLLMGGHAGEGKLLLGEGWASNGHWLIRLDCFKGKPKATKGIQLGELTSGMRAGVTQDAKQCANVEANLTDERVTIDKRRYSRARSDSEKTDRVTHVRFTNTKSDGKPGAFEAWADLAYVEWLADLGPVKWFLGRGYLDPLRVENNQGETIAILSPVRK